MELIQTRIRLENNIINHKIYNTLKWTLGSCWHVCKFLFLVMSHRHYKLRLLLLN